MVSRVSVLDVAQTGKYDSEPNPNALLVKQYSIQGAHPSINTPNPHNNTLTLSCPPTPPPLISHGLNNIRILYLGKNGMPNASLPLTPFETESPAPIVR